MKTKITERQGKILNILVKEYINLAQPVSSGLLRERYKFEFCPATIRNEMQRLTEMGYLFQPHTSAGRVPTSRGYQLYVEELLGLQDNLFFEDFFKEFDEIKKDAHDQFRFVESLTKTMASLSSNLVFAYLLEEDILWKEGWKEVFQNPEFKEPNFLENFLEATDCLEKNIKNFIKEIEDFPKVQIYIGKKEPFLKSKDFSLIVSKTKFPEEKGILAFLGPKRMTYEKNIGLINSLIKELEEI